MDAKTKILVIDDELSIRRFMRATLVANGYTILESATAEEGMTQAAVHMPDLIILDLGLPDMDGLAVLKVLREWATMPVIVVSARDRDIEKAEVLDAGADDYLTKPFAVEELLARMRVAFRHVNMRVAAIRQEPVFTVGGLQIDFERRLVTMNGERVHMSPTEYKLLACLARNAGRVLTHHQLLTEVWSLEESAQTHYPRIYMQHLRRKLESNPSQPRYLITKSGVGYMLSDQ